jgi:flagellar hook protein FlgE
MSILNTSVSGMQANSNWLSSISQNVANANTTGYKNVETDFSSLVDQIASGNADFGGVSTTQVSLNGLQGNVVSTSTATDLAVQGSGFFVVSDSSGTLYLTRNGSFTPDASGNLVNSAGYYLMASNVQNGVTPLAANSLTGLQKVNVVNAGQTATPTTTGSLTANLPSTATPVAAANLPSANSASSTYGSDVACRVR